MTFYQLLLHPYLTHLPRHATGNALGYVRMVRSASMYYCSEAVKYLPDFDDLVSFEECAGEGLRAPVETDDGAGEFFVSYVCIVVRANNFKLTICASCCANICR